MYMVDIVANFHLLVQAISHYIGCIQSDCWVGPLWPSDAPTLVLECREVCTTSVVRSKTSAGFLGMNQPGFGDWTG